MGGCLDNLFQSQATFTQLFCDGHNSYAAPTWDSRSQEEGPTWGSTVTLCREETQSMPSTLSLSN